MWSWSAWQPDCRLQPSRWLWRYLVAVHLVAGLAVAQAALPLPWPSLMLALTVPALAFSLRWYRLRVWPGRRPQDVRAFRFEREQWWVQTGTGRWLKAELHQARLLQFWLQMQFRTPRHARWLMLWPDQLPAAEFRRLRVFLRYREDERRIQLAATALKEVGTSTVSTGSGSSSG